MTGHTARRTPVHRGPAAWSVILPDQPAPVLAEGDMTVDVAIIGAGFAGLSAARRLRQIDPTARVAVLEAGRLAEGASGRNSGFMIDLPHELTSKDYAGAGDDRRVIALNRHAIAFARATVGECGINPNYFDPAGKVNGAASDAAHQRNQSYARHLEGLGEPFEHLDAQAMHDMTGSRHYLSGLYTPGTVMLQPAGYIRGLGAGLRRAGVGIYEQSPVTRITREGAGWCLVTPRARISAGKVILTTNGHLESFGFTPGRLMHVFLYASMTAEMDRDTRSALGGAPRWGITPSDPMGTTLRRLDTGQGGNRIVTRTCATFAPGMEVGARALRRAAAVHRAKFAQRFPHLRDLRQEHIWAGHLCLSRNGVSVMRELEPGLYVGCVQNGLGTARGTLTGIGAAELACGTTSAITRHFTAQPDPTPLPPRPLATLGANGWLRWKEWRARED